MIKRYFISAFLFFPLFVLSQQRPGHQLVVDVEKLDLRDSLEYFSVALFNNSDSVLCFLYPNKFNMSTANFLELCQTSNSNGEVIEYEFKNSACNDLMDAAIPLYEGLCILPFQTKTFTISVNKTALKKEVIIDYFYRKDYVHSKFLKKKKRRGWYRQYEIINKVVRLD